MVRVYEAFAVHRWSLFPPFPADVSSLRRQFRRVPDDRTELSSFGEPAAVGYEANHLGT
jgi:hypothetical protein